MSSVTSTRGGVGTNASASARPRPPALTVWVVVAGLLLVPALLMFGKSAGMPTAEMLRHHVSLDNLTPALRGKVTDILFVPVGALVVVVFRLTLGLRVLGPFRSVLLAFALLATGAAVGVAFLAVTVGVLLLCRPLIKALRLPYFGRISIMLSTVAVAIVAGALVGSSLGYARLEEVAYLPVVVICLVGEAVARTVRREGVGSGTWRAVVTVLAAVLVALLVSLEPLRTRFAEYPELIFLPIAGIVVVSRFLDFRLLASLNPKPEKRSRRTRDDDDPLDSDSSDDEDRDV